MVCVLKGPFSKSTLVILISSSARSTQPKKLNEHTHTPMHCYVNALLSFNPSSEGLRNCFDIVINIA